jgi:hypothetical protein
MLLIENMEDSTQIAGYAKRSNAMTCPYLRQIDLTTDDAKLNSYCDGEELWRLRVATPLDESRYCNTADYSQCPILHKKTDE